MNIDRLIIFAMRRAVRRLPRIDHMTVWGHPRGTLICAFTAPGDQPASVWVVFHRGKNFQAHFADGAEVRDPEALRTVPFETGTVGIWPL